MQPTLKLGSKGTPVALLQAILYALDYSVGEPNMYDATTREAVTRFQSSRGLKVDGIVGPETWAQLLKENPTGTTTVQTLPGGEVIEVGGAKKTPSWLIPALALVAVAFVWGKK